MTWIYILLLYCVVSVWCVPTVLQVKCRLGSQSVALLTDGGMSKGGPSGKSWVTVGEGMTFMQQQAQPLPLSLFHFQSGSEQPCLTCLIMGSEAVDSLEHKLEPPKLGDGTQNSSSAVRRLKLFLFLQ